jgi:soluble lytic murein transglycosylase-like protein
MMKTKTVFLSAALVLVFSGVISAAPADLKKLYHPIVEKVSVKYRIDADLIHAIIRAESNYDRFAVSNKGAMGLMQLMPATAAQYGVKNVFDPSDNIEGGTRYLKDLVELYDGRTPLVLAAYNAGQEAVKKYKGIPPYPETRTYISRIQATYQKQVTSFRRRVFRSYDENGRLVLTNAPPRRNQIRKD